MSRRVLASWLLVLSLMLALGGCEQQESRGSPSPEPSVTLTPEPPVRPSPGPSVASPPASLAPSATPTPTAPPTPPPRPVKIQMAGDILLHTSPVRAARTSEGYDFTPYFSVIKPYLDGDLVICNMESPVDVSGGNKDLSSYPVFNVPYEILPALRDTGFNFLLTANNHAYDKKFPGLVATVNNIRKAEMDFTGTFENRENFLQYKILDISGLRVGILNYSDADNGMGVTIPADKLPFTMRRFTSGSTASIPDMTNDIAGIRAAGAQFVIVALHWGAEYRDTPSRTQMEIARALCDGGADVIMGSHPHCVQPVEWRTYGDGGKSLILYSLGNFFADQIDMDKPIPKTQYGMLVSFTLLVDGNGGFQWGAATAMPTLAYRYRDNTTPNGRNYRLLPAGLYADRPDRPALFVSDREWDKAKTAFAHVTGIVGDAVPVFGG